MILDPDWLVSAFKLCHLDVGCLVFVTNTEQSSRKTVFTLLRIYMTIILWSFFFFFFFNTEKRLYLSYEKLLLRRRSY